MCGFAFVDDADIIQTGQLGDSTTSLIRKAQQELQLWEELIKATGGAIVPEKSDYTAINFKYLLQKSTMSNKSLIKGQGNGALQNSHQISKVIINLLKSHI